MDTRALMWVILGVILVLGGIVSSLREGTREPRPARPVNKLERPAAVPAAVPAATRPAEKKFDTGFSIDPVRGLKRKDENAEYFK